MIEAPPKTTDKNTPEMVREDAGATTSEMLAAVLHGREDLRVERVRRPKAGTGELVLGVGVALTCGTDLKVYRRGYHAVMGKPPMLFGHEVAGTIAEVGLGVEGFRAGERVVALNSAPCDRCFFCRHGQQNLCEDLLFNNGAYAEYLRVPARIVVRNTLKVPERMPLEFAALTEPLACVMRGLEETAAKAGDTMVVIGAGPIGLMFMHAAELAGVEVIAIVKRPTQIAAAKLFGARQVVCLEGIEDDAAIVAAARELTPEGRGADSVIEAVATPRTWEWAVDIVRRGGVVNFFGGPPSGTKVALDTNRLHYGDITLKASFHHTPATCRSAFALLESGRFKCSEYITGRASLADVPAIYARMMDRSARMMDRSARMMDRGGAAMPADQGAVPALSQGNLVGGVDIKTAIYPGLREIVEPWDAVQTEDPLQLKINDGRTGGSAG